MTAEPGKSLPDVRKEDMNSSMPKPLVLQAIDALQNLDRRRAVALLKQDLSTSPPGGTRWLSVAKLAANIGERGLETEAMRLYAQTIPQTLDHLLAYGQALVGFGRSADAAALIEALPAEARNHPAALHFCGMIASEAGDFSKAESYFRRVLAANPLVAQTWYSLAVIKTFTADDPDIALMDAIRPDFDRAPAEVKSLFLYAQGKAWHDAGDTDRAARIYEEGASIMRAAYPSDGQAWQAFAGSVVRDFTRERLTQLTPSGCADASVIFVTGLPRSGTTLVEQILTSHSGVGSGGELNLTDGAFVAAGDFSISAALTCQSHTPSKDPWGDMAQDYLALVRQQCGTAGRIVDKTLNQSRLMGVLLHAMPNAKVIWLRRNPEDCALSIFRTHFRNSLPWSWSLSEIANQMRGEDKLYAHWAAMFPDNILTVPYESLVSESEAWTRRILAHVGLTEEPQVFTPHTLARSVMTASVAQVRAPINTDRIGAAAVYGSFMDEFRRAYNA